MIDEACRTLHLPTIRSRWEELAATALKERAPFKDFLADLLEAECLQREERKKASLVREANFRRAKRLEDFEFDKNLNIVPEQVNTLADPSWVKAGLPLCQIGDSGTGKSHLLIGIGTAIAEADLRVRYTTTTNLVNELAEAADEKKLNRTLARYGRVDLLCLDEFGYLDLDKTARSCCSRCSRSARNDGRSPSRRTLRSRSGSRPSPTRGSARRSWTGSPSTRTSLRPAPAPSAWPTLRFPSYCGDRDRRDSWGHGIQEAHLRRRVPRGSGTDRDGDREADSGSG